MSKLIDPNDYIKLSTYGKKYGICNRKLYRHIDDDNIDHVKIDGVSFIRDVKYVALQKNNSGRKPKNVEPLTLKTDNVEPLTFKASETIDNEEVKNVEPLTLLNVETLTVKMDELLLLTKDEKICSISELRKIIEIKEKYKIV